MLVIVVTGSRLSTAPWSAAADARRNFERTEFFRRLFRDTANSFAPHRLVGNPKYRRATREAAAESASVASSSPNRAPAASAVPPGSTGRQTPAGCAPVSAETISRLLPRAAKPGPAEVAVRRVVEAPAIPVAILTWPACTAADYNSLMESLSGKFAIVTGGTRGIGRAITEASCAKASRLPSADVRRIPSTALSPK